MSKKIFSGVQPTGNLHLGNYLGAIKNFVELNNDEENECIFCVVDLHAITIKQDKDKLKNNIFETAATFIASGIDPSKSIIFNQSKVHAHAEGSWMLSEGPDGWLNRMTQFKEKAEKDKEKASVGLYIYPILMASDILLYDATHVPVGEEKTTFGVNKRLLKNLIKIDCEDFLKAPEPLIKKSFSRIMSLKDGLKKMSKSDPSDLSRINLSDTKDDIVIKIKKAKTDSFPIPSEENKLKNRPEAANLLGIYSSLANQSMSKTLDEFGGKNFSDFKTQLAEIVSNKMSPISDEIKKLVNDKQYLDSILQEGANKAEEIAGKKIKEMKKIIGF